MGLLLGVMHDELIVVVRQVSGDSEAAGLLGTPERVRLLHSSPDPRDADQDLYDHFATCHCNLVAKECCQDEPS